MRTSVLINESERNLFNEEYEEDVIRDLKKGENFAYSYNHVQYDKIRAIAEEIAQKKEKKTGAKFIVRCVNFGEGDTEKSSIIGWKVIKLPTDNNT